MNGGTKWKSTGGKAITSLSASNQIKEFVYEVNNMEKNNDKKQIKFEQLSYGVVFLDNKQILGDFWSALRNKNKIFVS